MKTYTGGRNLYGKITNDTSSANLSFGDEMINEGKNELLGEYDWRFLEDTATTTTVASQDSYALPYDFNKAYNVIVTVGSTNYQPREVVNRKDWDDLNSSTSTSTIPQYFFIYNRELYLYPTPSANGNTITVNYKKDTPDIGLADYTTGTIVSITNGDTTVTGNGTSWTNQMEGRWIKITKANTVNTGDGRWYRIDSVTSATELELERAYGGNSIAAGAATYTMGEAFLIPEKFQMAPIDYAVAEYWYQTDDISRGDRYRLKFDNAVKKMKREEGTSTTSNTADLTQTPMQNPNFFVTK
jgi:hypothetical protein